MPLHSLSSLSSRRGDAPWAIPGLALLLALLLALPTTACSARESSSPGARSSTVGGTPPSSPPSGNAPPATGGAAAQPAARAYIAEAHTYSFFTPAARLKPLWQKHLDACRRLGPGGCDVEAANLSNGDDGSALSASLSIRVANAQAGAFLAMLDADTPREHEIGRTDKTGDVIDADARLINAQQLLTRLQALRASAGKLADVVDLETHIADVQAQIETAKGTREYLRQQTEQTKIDLSYNADGGTLAVQTWQPVHDAIGHIGPTLAATIGILIYALTVLIPIGLLLGICWWLVHRFHRRSRGRQVLPPPPSSPAP